MNKLSELIELCPCEVKIGYAYEYTGGYYISTNTIMINSGLDEDQQFATLAHELQHAECQLLNCVCRKYRIGNFLREYHAFKSQIIRCLENTPALRCAIRIIQDGIADDFDGDFPGHVIACKKLMATKLWQKALKLCGIPLQ